MAKDPFKYFRPEAAELVGQLSAGFLELEKGGPSAATVARLFRVAHTLKGAARIVKHKELADLSHELETWMTPMREGTAPARFDDALALVDAMSGHVATMFGKPAPIPEPVAPRATIAEAAPILLAVDRNDLTPVLDGLAELQVKLAQLHDAVDPSTLPARVEQLEREVRRVREDVETLQLHSARALFKPLERLIRDARVPADLTTHGGDVRLDPQVLAVLHAALVQLVRNAIAHGLESPAERLAAGKPERAQLAIRLVQHGARVRIDFTDDGRGIDVPAVHRALVKRGGVVPPIEDRAAVMRELLHGTISTAEKVTDLSGRGVGLDVVRDAARQLGGEVSVASEPGAGTAFSITVPVSLATMQVLLVASADRVIGIPIASIERVRQVRPEHLVAHERSIAFVHDDISLPYAALHQILRSRACTSTSVVLMKSGVALGVERVLGVHDVVHRASPAGVTLDPLVSGLIIDDAGVPRPVLDPEEVTRAVTAAETQPVAPRMKPAPILIIDDSLTTRMLEQAILTSAGYDVELASSAEEGLAKAERGRYALFLVDVEMPGMDGFTFVATTRADPALGRVPAILVSSRNAPEDFQRGTSAGAAGYVVKGEFDQTELLALIARLV